MCKLCESCVSSCYCPRCPKNSVRTVCPVCEVDCNDAKCSIDPIVVTEHLQCNAAVFCQICIETTHGVKLTHQLMCMYCDEHEPEHKKRMGQEIKKWKTW